MNLDYEAILSAVLRDKQGLIRKFGAARARRCLDRIDEAIEQFLSFNLRFQHI